MLSHSFVDSSLIRRLQSELNDLIESANSVLDTLSEMQDSVFLLPENTNGTTTAFDAPTMLQQHHGKAEEVKRSLRQCRGRILQQAKEVRQYAVAIKKWSGNQKDTDALRVQFSQTSGSEMVTRKI